MPEPLPVELHALELRVRGLIKELVESVEGCGHVYTRPLYADDKGEWLKLVTVKHPANKTPEVSYVFISFVDDPEEDYTAGSTEQKFVYDIEIARSLAERADATNSHDDFVAFLMRLRKACRENRSHGYESHQLYRSLLLSVEPAGIDEKDGALVHRTIKRLEVEVRS